MFLIKGLSTKGIPKNLKNSTIEISYNNIKDLKKLNKKNIAALVIEGSRYDYPSKSFLKEIQKICKKKRYV